MCCANTADVKLQEAIRSCRLLAVHVLDEIAVHLKNPTFGTNVKPLLKMTCIVPKRIIISPIDWFRLPSHCAGPWRARHSCAACAGRVLERRPPH